MPTQLINAFVEALPYTESAQVFYRDSALKGFGLRVGTNSKVYIAEAKVNNKSVRVTIGRHGPMTAEQAREKAQGLLAMMQRGVNPNEFNMSIKAESVTLGQVYESYIAARPNLKARTLYGYSQLISNHFDDWANKPITAISQEDIASKHMLIGEKSLAQAKLAMRFINALLNFAISQQNGRLRPFNNSTKHLSKIIQETVLERHQGVISQDQLSAWLKAVHILPTISNGANKEAVKDYLLLLIFTGLRGEQGLAMQWSNIDFKAKTLIVSDPTTQAINTLPLSTFLYYLLKKRHEDNTTGSPFVFPGADGKSYLDDPGKQIKIVTQASGIRFTPQDLRRTFAAIAESLSIPISIFPWLNHQTANINVKAGYVSSEPEPLKRAMQEVADYLMSQTLKA